MTASPFPTLRPCGVQDAELLAALHQSCFPDDPWNAQTMAALLVLPNTWGILSLSKEEPLGFVLLRQAADELEILAFGVLPDSRAQGLGKQLLMEVISKVLKLDVTEIFLEVAEDNYAALALYSKMGFQQVGMRQGYYQRTQGKSCDALILKLFGKALEESSEFSKNT